MFPVSANKSVPSLLLSLLLILNFVRRTIQTGDDGYDVWKEGDIPELYKALNCKADRPQQDELAVHSTDTWKLLQSAYNGVVGEDKSSLPTGGFIGLDGFYVPYKIDHGPHGRGIFATKFIDEGTLIWRSFQTARFETGAEYRQYLHALPPELACDILHWAYTRKEARDDGYSYMVACVDLDPGSFVNEGANSWENNMKVAVPRSSGCDLDFRAARDIEAGEELRINYAFSEFNPGWATMGLVKDMHSSFGFDDEHEEGEGEGKPKKREKHFEHWPEPPKVEL
jgi:hypothetical protein